MVKEFTPWITTPNLNQSAREVDLEKAKEVTPILMFGVLPPLVVHPQGIDFRPVDHTPPEDVIKGSEKLEAEVDAETGPKAPDPNVTSSATNNASSSGIDSLESGPQVPIDPLMTLHPSSLPLSPESPASAVKDPSEEPPPFPLL